VERPTTEEGYAAQTVRGLTFLTARTYFIDTWDEATFERLMLALPDETRSLFTEAMMSEMYPEAHMQRFMHRVYDELAAGDDEAFLEIVRGLALAGVSKFFKVLLGFASARFVLRKIPTIFARLREGTAVLTVEEGDAAVQIHYAEFPFCRDHVYRLLSLGNCQAIVMAATKEIPEGHVVRYGPDSMTLELAAPPRGRKGRKSGSSMTSGKIPN
jgi:hypothetical protein